MRGVVVVVWALSLVCVWGQTDLRRLYESSSTVSLTLLELRKVMKEGQPLAKDYNVKVILDQHESLPSLSYWDLVLKDSGGKEGIYKSQANSYTQTEIEFETDITDVNFVFVVAKDSSSAVIATSFDELEIKDGKSKLAWVGSEYVSSRSHLRVDTGFLQEVKAGEMICRQKNTPCYFLNAELPEDIPRCSPILSGVSKNTVNVCDDTITRFQGTAESTQVERSGNNLTVRADFSTAPSKVEVVVVDPSDPSTMLSPEGYKCQRLEDSRHPGYCTQQLNGAKDLKKLMVIVVALDSEGYVLESSLTMYDESNGIVTAANTGVIVGSILGGLLAILLIVGLGLYLVRRNKSSTKKSASRASGNYRAANTEDQQDDAVAA